METREIFVMVKYFDGDVLLYRVMATEQQIAEVEESGLRHRVAGTDEEFEEIFGAPLSEIGEYIEVGAIINRE